MLHLLLRGQGDGRSFSAADTQPQEPETPADSGTSDGSTEAPSISLPTQEEVEQAASSLYNAASTILDAIYNAASQNDAA